MIFIDTGAFIARYIVEDQFHELALSKWTAIEDRQVQCVTSNFVIDETITLLGRIADIQFAAKKARIFYSSNSLLILRPDLAQELQAISYMEKFADQKICFTDYISFSLMKEKRIKEAFSFDKHFQIAGFELF